MDDRHFSHKRKNPKNTTDRIHIHTGKPLVRQNLESTFIHENRICAKTSTPIHTKKTI
jgi:hypothetical protein